MGELSFPAGETVTLTAVEDEGGSYFAGWSRADCPGLDPCEVTVNADKSVTATFKEATVAPTEYTLTVTLAGNGSGTVTATPSSGESKSCASSETPCELSFPAGETVTLTAVEDEGGSYFAGWSRADCPGLDPCEVTVNANKSVTATFGMPS